jgi:menaquinone-dependent protoporphyrinogen oxidase
MAPTTLIAYATKHDSTHQAAELVADVLREDGLAVDVRPARKVDDVERYAAVVVGGAMYMGRWHKDARHLLHTLRDALAQRPVFVFGMGPLDRKETSIAAARDQLDHALSETPEIEPVAVAVFGGVVHPEDHRFPFNHMPEGDARDPDAIRAWASDIATVVRVTTALTAA